MLTNVIRKEQIASAADQSQKDTPVVALFMPFEPKMVAKNVLVQKLQLLVLEAEQKLAKGFSISVAEPVLKRLKATVKNLDYSTHKKSIAIYASAKGEKVFYLDTPLENKVVVDTSFNIRFLVEAKKNLQHYLVLVLGSNISRVYSGNGGQLVSMFTSIRKKSKGDYAASLENFLKEIDNNLSIILNYFPSLPLFVMGSAYRLSKYKTVTQNKPHITQLIEVNSEEIAKDKINAALQPYLCNWKNVQLEHLQCTLNNAMESNRIVTGIDQVAKTAN